MGEGKCIKKYKKCDGDVTIAGGQRSSYVNLCTTMVPFHVFCCVHLLQRYRKSFNNNVWAGFETRHEKQTQIVLNLKT